MSAEMNRKFTDDPLRFMAKYAVDPGNDLGNVGIRMAKLDPGATIADDYFFNSMHENRRVGFLDFNKRPRATGLLSASGVVKISGSTDDTPGFVRSYYLPWQGNRIIRLSIPAINTSLLHDDVKYFFTAAISGCSIFVRGTPQAPVVFHAGGNTGAANANSPDGAAAFWRNMMQQHPAMGTPTAEINKTNYVVDAGAAAGDKSTAHSRQFDAWIKANHARDLNIEETAATGCVMGIRDLQGNWSFYLQENVTITHSRFRKILGIQTSKTVKGSQTTSVRPMLFRKFYPGGLGHANFVPSMPRAL